MDEVREESSILVDVKKLLGIEEDNEDFDTDIIIHINTAFTILNQLGVGPRKIFRITDAGNTWDEFLDMDKETLESVKTYVYLKVKMVFDPPLNGSLMKSFEDTIRELEWRLNFAVESNDLE